MEGSHGINQVPGSSCIIFILAVGGRMAYQFGYHVFAQQPLSDPPGKEAALTVQEGDTIKEIAEILEADGIIPDALVFCVQERLSKYQGELSPRYICAEQCADTGGDSPDTDWSVR